MRNDESWPEICVGCLGTLLFPVVLVILAKFFWWLAFTWSPFE